MRLATIGASAALTGGATLAIGCGDDSGADRDALVAATTRAVVSAAHAACGKPPIASLERTFLRRARRPASGRHRLFVRNFMQSRSRLRRSDAYPQVIARLYAMSLPSAERGTGYAACSRALEHAGRAGGRS
jgi:hypothetical protein